MSEAENTLTGDTQTGTDGTQERTFTQDDVNRIVQERLAKERSKGTADDEINRRSAELDQRERKLIVREKLHEKGLPDYLADALNIGSDEELEASLEAVLKMKGETGSTEQVGRVVGHGNPIGVVTKGTDTAIRDAFGLKG